MNIINHHLPSGGGIHPIYTATTTPPQTHNQQAHPHIYFSPINDSIGQGQQCAIGSQQTQLSYQQCLANDNNNQQQFNRIAKLNNIQQFQEPTPNHYLRQHHSLQMQGGSQNQSNLTLPRNQQIQTQNGLSVQIQANVLLPPINNYLSQVISSCSGGENNSVKQQFDQNNKQSPSSSGSSPVGSHDSINSTSAAFAALNNNNSKNSVPISNSSNLAQNHRSQSAVSAGGAAGPQQNAVNGMGGGFSQNCFEIRNAYNQEFISNNSIQAPIDQQDSQSNQQLFTQRYLATLSGSSGSPRDHQYIFEDHQQQEEEDDDVSNESIAERKIVKIDRRLSKNRQVIDKTQKRRLQNRKSALKCRLRKSHLIATLQAEVAHLKQERQSFISEVIKLKDLVREEQLNNSQLLIELTKTQATVVASSKQPSHHQPQQQASQSIQSQSTQRQTTFIQNTPTQSQQTAVHNNNNNFPIILTTPLQVSGTPSQQQLSGILTSQYLLQQQNTNHHQSIYSIDHHNKSAILNLTPIQNMQQPAHFHTTHQLQQNMHQALTQQQIAVGHVNPLQNQQIISRPQNTAFVGPAAIFHQVPQQQAANGINHHVIPNHHQASGFINQAAVQLQNKNIQHWPSKQ